MFNRVAEICLICHLFENKRVVARLRLQAAPRTKELLLLTTMFLFFVVPDRVQSGSCSHKQGCFKGLSFNLQIFTSPKKLNFFADTNSDKLSFIHTFLSLVSACVPWLCVKQ
jgi:hypothetical protein